MSTRQRIMLLVLLPLIILCVTGCDWCAIQGRYGDGHCDEGCRRPDPDCTDTCENNGLYGDGYCDDWCPKPDPDCDIATTTTMPIMTTIPETTTTMSAETTTTTSAGAATTTIDTSGQRFQDNGDGTVTDTRTGLVWLKNANPCGSKIWDDAVAYCNSLASGTAGLTDGSVAGQWRLPSKEALQGIGTDPPTTWEGLPSVTWTMPAAPFLNVLDRVWWTSTRYVMDDGYWAAQMGNGQTDGFVENNLLNVWPVRGGNPTSSTTTTAICSGNTPVDCGNGHCCPSDKPLCGTGPDVGKCFAQNPLNYNLNVEKGGTGTGTVTGQGIDCGADCSNSYPAGTVVNLTAVAAGTSSSFINWSGCDSANGNTCTVTMNQDKHVTAVFDYSFSTSLKIINLPETSSTGTYLLQWQVTGLESNVYTIQEDKTSSFSNPTMYYIQDGSKQKQFTNKPDGIYWYRVSMAGGTYCSPDSITVARTTPPPPTDGTYNPSFDNELLWGYYDSTLKNTVFSRVALGVGSDYLQETIYDADFNPITYNIIAATNRSLLYFDIDSDIAGKAIAKATLTLYPKQLPGIFYYMSEFRMNAVARDWNPNNVTWNNQPGCYETPFDTQDPPTSAAPTEWDVTGIVQLWANGTRPNYGFLLWDPSWDYHPGDIALCSTYYESLESASTAAKRPTLVIEYQ